MKDKLRAHLAKTKGFTLVELLVVIAIIAILVLLVIIALDPIERIRDANDRTAQNAVRQAGTAVAACIVKEQSRTPPVNPFVAAGPCDTPADLAAAFYISNAASLAGIDDPFTLAAGNICVHHLNAGGHNGGVGGGVTWNFNVGLVSDPEAGGQVC